MAEVPYLRPPWFARVVGNRLAAFLNPSVRVLSVRGRTSGQWRVVAVVVLEHQGQRYLLAPSGHTHWSQNLRASGAERLRDRGRTDKFTAVEIPVDQRQPLIQAYLRRTGSYQGSPRPSGSYRTLPTTQRFGSSSPAKRTDAADAATDGRRPHSLEQVPGQSVPWRNLSSPSVRLRNRSWSICPNRPLTRTTGTDQACSAYSWFTADQAWCLPSPSRWP